MDYIAGADFWIVPSEARIVKITLNVNGLFRAKRDYHILDFCKSLGRGQGPQPEVVPWGWWL